MRFRIRNKILASFLIFMLIEIIVTVASIVNMNKVYKSDNKISDNQYRAVYYSGETQKNLLRVQNALQKAIIFINDAEEVNRQLLTVSNCADSLNRQLREAEKLVAADEGKELLEDIKGKWLSYCNIDLNKIIKAIKEKNIVEAKNTIKMSSYEIQRCNDSLEEFSNFETLMKYKMNASNNYYGDNRRVYFMSAIIFLLSMFIITHILNYLISNPIGVLIEAVEKFAGGNFKTFVNIKQNDEIGQLAASFNLMASKLNEKKYFRELTLEITKVLASSATLKELLSKSLKMLMDASNCQIGAVYLKQEGNDVLKLAESFGFGDHLKQEVKIGEGLIGSAAMSDKLQLLKDIQNDTLFNIHAIDRTIMPRTVLYIPLFMNGKTIGIFAMGSIYTLNANQIEIIEASKTQLTIAISNAMAYMKTECLAEKLKANNEELQAQSEQLIEAADKIETQRIELEKADKLKSEFLSNMSHELRTPLNSIMALSQLMILHGNKKIPSDEFKYIEIIERNGRHLLSLINDILDLSKIESGRMDLNIEKVEPRRIIEWTTDTVKEMSEKKGLYIIVNIEDETLMYSDVAKIRQIMLNLISNAIKFTDNGGLEVKVTSENGNVLFAVKDTGVGLDIKNQEYIFDKFRQADGSVTRRHEGTGLGLAICRKLSRLLGGDVTVESKVGVGSTFTLSLPINYFNYDTTSVINNSKDDGATNFPLEKKTILVIDDVKYICTLLKDYLEEAGYDVLVANSGSEGIKIASENKVDAITLDMYLPGMSGQEIIEKLKATENTKDIPIIIVSASDSNDTFKSLDADAFVTKPVDKRILQEEIDKLVKRKRTNKPSNEVDNKSDEINNFSAKPILIVEDNADNMFTITALLKDMGFDCVTAADGLRGIEIAKQTKPAMILMDIQLPGLSGLDVTKQIKGNSELSNIPIIALTAKVMKGDCTEILAAGCDDYLPKPIEYEELKEKIYKWMRHS